MGVGGLENRAVLKETSQFDSDILLHFCKGRT